MCLQPEAREPCSQQCPLAESGLTPSHNMQYRNPRAWHLPVYECVCVCVGGGV